MSSVVVFKIGGHIALGQLNTLARSILQLQTAGMHGVVVHGGGPSITRALERKNLVMPFVDGIRVTSPEAMEVVADVIRKEINPQVVQGLREAGVAATGCVDEHVILHAMPIEGLQRTGRVTGVNTDVIHKALRQGLVPVLPPIGADTEGCTYNVNADMVASAVAGALRAERAIFLTDVHGIYESLAEDKLVRRASTDVLVAMRERGCFRAGMLPKVEAILTTLELGAQHVFVIHGQDEAALQWALSSDPHSRDMDWMIRGTCITNVKERTR